MNSNINIVLKRKRDNANVHVLKGGTTLRLKTKDCVLNNHDRLSKHFEVEHLLALSSIACLFCKLLIMNLIVVGYY